MDDKDRRIAQLEAALRVARREHTEACASYSISIRPYGQCVCGASEHNAKIDRALIMCVPSGAREG